MLKNYIRVAIRHFLRHKTFSFINILCLSIGLTFSMIIGLFIFTELNINGSFKNADRQFFIKSIWKEKGMGSDLVSIPQLAKTIKEQYPGLVASYYRYNPVTNVVSAGDQHFKENIAIGDTTLVSALGFPLLYGDRNRAFTNNSSAVITESLARKLFGTANAIGKTLSIETTVAGASQEYVVSAVLKDIPYNSVTHLVNNDGYSVYVPATGSRFYQIGDPSLSWDNPTELSFIELKPGIQPQTIVQVLNTLLRKNSPDYVYKNIQAGIVPVRLYHLNDNEGAVRKMMIVLGLIAVFILCMVIINFVNINIGTSSTRLKEIGLRKTFGSERKHIMWQFLTEAYILTFITGIISLVFYQLLHALFSQILHVSLPAIWQLNMTEYLFLALLMLAIGFLAGIYPAFILSATNLIQAVKGKAGYTTGSFNLKRALLVVQFSLAVLVFICSINVSRQVSYIFNKDLGYNKEQLLVITAFPKQWDSAGVLRMETIKQSLQQFSFVKNATLTFELPDRTPFGRIVVYPPKPNSSNAHLDLATASADEDFAKTFGIKMKAGHFFDDDKHSVVLNETAVRQLGLTPDNAVGQKMGTLGGGSMTIGGVMQDFHVSSLQDRIGPIAFFHISGSNTYRYLVVKLNTNNMHEAVETIRARWKQFAPSAPFDYTFMDEKFASLYDAELQLQKAGNIATMLNLIIVLLGIIGVMSFMLARRTKEIAVRKVLGADTLRIVMIFIKEYAVLLVIANIIAWPLAYLASAQLLQNFAYRVEQSLLPYATVFIGLSLLAFLLIGAQSFRTAIANPVKSLRSE